MQAMPGTPHNSHTPQQIVEQALAEAEVLASAGFDAIVLENMHDRPYLNKEVGPEVVATMARACAEVRRLTDLPIGIQVLAGANEQAIAVAHGGGGGMGGSKLSVLSCHLYCMWSTKMRRPEREWPWRE